MQSTRFESKRGLHLKQPLHRLISCQCRLFWARPHASACQAQLLHATACFPRQHQGHEPNPQASQNMYLHTGRFDMPGASAPAAPAGPCCNVNSCLKDFFGEQERRCWPHPGAGTLPPAAGPKAGPQSAGLACAARDGSRSFQLPSGFHGYGLAG